MTILYHEALVLHEDAPVAGDRTISPGRESSRLRFEAFGREFELQIEPNLRLARRGSGDGYELLRGRIAGIAGSWVRLTRHGDRLSGIIHDGQDSYVIEPRTDVLADLIARDRSPGTTNLIFRLADTRVPAGVIYCESGPPGMVSAEAAVQKLAQELGTAPKLAAQGALQRLSVGTVADYEFFNAFGADTETEILSRFNIVDGIFSSELGIEIGVDDVRVFSTSNDPFTQNDPSKLLDQVSAWRVANHTQFGLTHMLTGRDMTGDTAGIGFLGSPGSWGVCRASSGASLSQSQGFGASTHALIIAHEIAHNFGAPHDGEPGSPCESTPPGFLMDDTINGSQQFSQCSKNEMQPVIDAASCLTLIPSVDLQVSAAPGILSALSAPFTADFEIVNLGSLSATGVTAQLTLPAGLTLDSLSVTAGACVVAQQACSLGTVSGNSTRMLSATLRADLPGDYPVTLQVAADADDDFSNNSAVINAQVRDAIDLQAQFTGNFDMERGQTREVTLAVDNVAAEPASNVTVGFSTSSGLQITNLQPTAGSCTLGVRPVCSTAALSGLTGFEVQVSLRGDTAGTKTLSATVSADELEVTPADNTHQLVGTISAPPAASSGGGSGGGGGLGWLSPTLLGLLGLWRRRSAAREETDAATVQGPVYTFSTTS